MFRTAIVLGGVVLVGTAFYYTDRALNYVEVEARIDKVESECHLERTKERVVYRKREWTRDADCDLVASIKADTPDYADMTIKRSTKVTVRYTSPADGQVHSSSYNTSGTGTSDPALVEGGTIHIMANKSKPETIQKY